MKVTDQYRRARSATISLHLSKRKRFPLQHLQQFQRFPTGGRYEDVAAETGGGSGHAPLRGARAGKGAYSSAGRFGGCGSYRIGPLGAAKRTDPGLCQPRRLAAF